MLIELTTEEIKTLRLGMQALNMKANDEMKAIAGSIVSEKTRRDLHRELDSIEDKSADLFKRLGKCI